MEPISWIAAGYILLLPPEFNLVYQDINRYPFSGPIQTLTTTCDWKNAQGDSIIFSWWKPLPLHPGYPMVVEKEVKGSWAGTPATFVETSVFEGIPRKVSAVFQKRADLGSTVRLYMPNADIDSLQQLLAPSKPNALTQDQASLVGCSVLKPAN